MAAMAESSVPAADRQSCASASEGHALQHGLSDVGGAGVGVEPEEDTACVRVVVRCSLAGEVGQEQDP